MVKTRGVKLISAQGPHGVNLFSRGPAKKIFFSKKNRHQKNFVIPQTQTEQQLHIFMLCKIISWAALNPFAGRMHNIRKNQLAGRMRPAGRTFDIPDLDYILKSYMIII